MDAIGQVLNRSDRPAYVRFERRPMEDRKATLEQGRYICKDVDFALITPPYSKDCVEKKVLAWFLELEMKVRNGRMPADWKDMYMKSYDSWKNGQEIPLNGTPIKGWGVISPAQQEMLIHINIRTVEDLAGVNDEGKARIGMGALDLKNKAIAWLAQLNDKGPLTQEMALLKNENAQLKGSLDALTEQVRKMQLQQSNPLTSVPHIEQNTITAWDILAPPISKGPEATLVTDCLLDKTTHEGLVQAYTVKFGKKPHHRMSDKTIKEALA